jgi:hypothetical protein
MPFRNIAVPPLPMLSDDELRRIEGGFGLKKLVRTVRRKAKNAVYDAAKFVASKVDAGFDIYLKLRSYGPF